jgi:disulfide bond formation protein DsbB
MVLSSTAPPRHPAYAPGALALLGAAAIILGALAFQYLGGLAPCPLCLEQRYAYYAGIPALFLALILLSAGVPRAAGVLFALVAVGFLANAGLGAYHAGVEWHWWAGPATCSGEALAPLGAGGSGGVLGQLATTRVIRCDEAPWALWGISLAGWNAIFSAILAIIAIKAAAMALFPGASGRR